MTSECEAKRDQNDAVVNRWQLNEVINGIRWRETLG